MTLRRTSTRQQVLLLLLAVSALLLTCFQYVYASDSSGAELVIHRRRECAAFNRTYVADFADASFENAAIETLFTTTDGAPAPALPADSASKAQWSRLTRCEGLSVAAEPCLAENVVLHDGFLLLNGSAAVRLATVLPSGSAQRLRVALDFPLPSDSSVVAATQLRATLRGLQHDDDVTLTLSPTEALVVSSTSRNVSVRTAAGVPCAHQPVAGSHRSVEVEVEWTDRGGLRVYWNDHLLLDHLAVPREKNASTTTPSPSSSLHVELAHVVSQEDGDIGSSRDGSDSGSRSSDQRPAPLRIARVDVQTQHERGSRECDPRIVPSASCRPRTRTCLALLYLDCLRARVDGP
ncbi:hypothetical protein PINS_up005854 [Pythium insidiosum]|nr:hypothetical protein PINS_up005854 [Pythium insidiosum]